MVDEPVFVNRICNTSLSYLVICYIYIMLVCIYVMIRCYSFTDIFTFFYEIGIAILRVEAILLPSILKREEGSDKNSSYQRKTKEDKI